ncbi:MAG: hypothetical protein H6765_05485 [Candidatus Peribacteria bacterium]|nr:MAG: hypothetical protein H6765_05485 [Candidatus Peribacteria bacterium]
MAGAGVTFVFSFSLETFTLLAALMAVVNGVASGGEVAFSKKLTGKYSALYLCWWSRLIIVLTNLPLSILLGEPQYIPTRDIVRAYQLGYAVSSMLAFWLVIE